MGRTVSSSLCSATTPLVIGIDIGGTNIKIGLVDRQGNILGRHRVATASLSRQPKAFLQGLSEILLSWLKDNGVADKSVAGVGIGFPGLLDYERGRVIQLPNIPGWRNVPAVDQIRRVLPFNVCIDNDVNLMTLGEWRFGAGVGCDHMVCLTLGTGIGGGLILNGALYRGADGVAGEAGHMPLNEDGPPCPCGGRACLERYLGNAVLLKQAQDHWQDPRMTLERATELVWRKDRRAVAFWEEVGVRLGNGLVGLVNCLNPRLIVLGGGVASRNPVIVQAVQQTIRSRAMTVQGKRVRIKRARLGNDAAVIGASVLLFNP